MNIIWINSRCGGWLDMASFGAKRPFHQDFWGGALVISGYKPYALQYSIMVHAYTEVLLGMKFGFTNLQFFSLSVNNSDRIDSCSWSWFGEVSRFCRGGCCLVLADRGALGKLRSLISLALSPNTGTIATNGSTSQQRNCWTVDWGRKICPVPS